MMAMTTSSSMRVNPAVRGDFVWDFIWSEPIELGPILVNFAAVYSLVTVGPSAACGLHGKQA